MMDTLVVKSALHLGFEHCLVEQIVQSKMRTCGENYKTVQELVSDLRMEEKEMWTASCKDQMKQSPKQQEQLRHLQEQLRHLQEERTCKVCMDEPAKMVFIPCGHLVVCEKCALLSLMELKGEGGEDGEVVIPYIMADREVVVKDVG
ncbi:unnamed protein product [Coregonus sp. 'balchen']|nr:unnamed protein product [Coregonus sp. 'balchen']